MLATLQTWSLPTPPLSCSVPWEADPVNFITQAPSGFSLELVKRRHC